jgi:hypothetical protein
VTAVYVDASSIRFPRRCPHCGRKAEGTYAVAAMRGLEAYVGNYTMPPLLDVPVCRDAFNRRRAAALASLLTILVLIALSAITGIVAAWRGAWLVAAVFGALALVLAAGGRTGWDSALLDRTILGLYARSVSSTRMRLAFRDDKYFAEWKGLNRSASSEP